MKAKHLIVIIFILIIACNTLIGAVITSYETFSCVLVDLGIIISAILFYYLLHSKIADGFKIGLTTILFFTGLSRIICMGLIGTEVSKSIALLIASIIFIIEVIFICVVSYLSKK